MLDLLSKIGMPRPIMALFFVVDTSGSMDGEYIGALNAALSEVIPDIRDLSETNPDAQIKVGVLEYSCGAEWLTPAGPIDATHFHWREVHAGGLTDFGAACAELNSKLSTEAFMQSATSCYAPVIILFTDGQPTDNWEAPLEDLKKNFWFNAAIKIAIAIGDSPDRQILAQFTGNRETVIDVSNKNVLHRLIKFVSVRASQVGSKNTGGGAATDDDKSKEIIQHLAEFQAEEHLPSNNQQNFVVAANEW